jgi:hypothetical protein
METRFNKAPATSVVTSTPRVTPAPVTVPFGEIMGRALSGGAQIALGALPGAPLMALAMRGGAAGISSASQPLGAAASAAGNAGAQSAAPGSASPEGPAASGTAGTAGGPGEAASIEGAMAKSSEMNLYYLRIQEQVNAQNRSFSTLSNVMKAEHETVKTAIGNIR